jgi:hypothetical protein
MKQVFTGSSRGEANRKAKEWCAKQEGLRVLERTEMTTSETGPSLDEAETFVVTIHY